ncbi:MAG: AMIN domain-containing protein [Syntrophales bacterium]|nr:AMIN domain-containing protein [Syntrophales bacterium]
MNSKPFILLLLILCLVESFSGLCAGEDQKSPLTVKKISFTSDKIGGEWISLFCNQSCTPELSSIEGENPRVVMDMKRVSLIQTKTRNVNTGGRLVKSIRSHLNKQTNILRVVLDLEPSKSYIVRPMQDPSGNYMLTIREDADSPRSQEKHITILRLDLRSEEQNKGKQEATSSPENRSAMKVVEDVPSMDQGRSQLNDGEFAAAVDIFTQILAAHPQDSLIYRLRGDAYDNLGDQQKALEDWTQAARLGDTIIQSYLDFLKVKWRENPAP